MVSGRALAVCGELRARLAMSHHKRPRSRRITGEIPGLICGLGEAAPDDAASPLRDERQPSLSKNPSPLPSSDFGGVLFYVFAASRVLTRFRVTPRDDVLRTPRG